MVIDTSALAAILMQEPEAAAIARGIEQDPVRWMSAMNWLELQIVMQSRYGTAGAGAVDSLAQDMRLEIAAFDLQHAQAALSVWQRFGKGRHVAGLNLGDCCAFATAELRNQPLLFKGSDFARTDIPAVQY